MTKKNIPTSIVITAIIALAFLECVAMFLGVNGKLFALIAAVIAGLAGFVLPSPFKTT